MSAWNSKMIPDYLLLFTMVSGLTAVFGKNVDKCEKEKNCSIRINETTAYHCVVGHKAACDRIASTGEPPPSGNPRLYPYLSTIGIYKRPVMSDHGSFESPSFNFSFKLPQTSFGVGGSALGVMAEFQEAPGYHKNIHYNEPICRLFNLSKSSFIDPDIIKAQKLAIPYNCIGIGITGSVFRLQLTTIPTNHALDYVISWEYPQGTYDDYEFIAETTQVWKEPMVAVATIPDEKCIHVVFVPPTSKDVLVNVSLQDRRGVVQSKLLENGGHEVIFVGVVQGNYWVTLEPKGNECEFKPNFCPLLRSFEIWINSSSEDGGDVAFATIVLAAGVVITSVFAVLVIVVAVYLLQKHNSLKNSQNPSSILVISQASRELEATLTSYFCSFLKEFFQTEVVYECPTMYSGETENMMITNDNSHSSLLRRGDSDKGNYLCAIHLLFSYSTSVNYDPGTSVYLLNQHGNAHGQWSICDDVVFKEKPQNSKSRRKSKTKSSPGLNTLVAIFTNDTGPRKSIGPLASDVLTNDEQITVMLHNQAFPKHDVHSMCNRPDLCPVTNHGLCANVYYLPGQMLNLFTELRDTLPKSKDISLDCKVIHDSELWRVIRELHGRASENQPSGRVVNWIHQIPEQATNSTITIFSVCEPVAPPVRPRTRLPACDETTVSSVDSFTNVSEVEQQLKSSQWDDSSFECPASAEINRSSSGFFQLRGAENMTGSCPETSFSATFPEPLDKEVFCSSDIPKDFIAQIIPPKF